MRDGSLNELLNGRLDREQVSSTEILVNLFDGGPNSKVTYAIDDGAPRSLEREIRNDPYIETLFHKHKQSLKDFVGPQASTHLWVGKLPADLGPGVYRIRVDAIDEWGRTHTAYRVLEVVGYDR